MTPLAALLAERGISQGELTRRTRLAGRTVSNAYHGRGVSFRTWVKIAKALDVKVAELDPEAAERAGGVL
jgi:DNA-binding Xre family transcriptional regulator